MEFAMGLNRFNLTLLGVWPEPTETSRARRYISSFVFWSSSFITFAFLCLPQNLHLVLESTSLGEIIENLSINIPLVFALTKQLVLRYNEKALKVLLGQIANDWTRSLPEVKKQTMLKNARISRLISIASSILTYIMLTAFITLQIWSNMQNTSETDLGGLLHPSTFPYDIKTSPNFEITWLGQFISTILTAICYASFDTFLAVLVLHLCGQLAVLRMDVRNLVDATRHGNFSNQKILAVIVHKHEELYRFANIIENCFNYTILGQTMICTAMICLTGYRMITSMDHQQAEMPIVGLVFYFVHVIYTILHFFIYCYVGEQLLNESIGMAQSAYDCEWYNLPPKEALSLIIIIIRSNISFKLTAGKFSQVSLNMFGIILRTSASYLSVLLAMRDRLNEEQ